MDPVLILTDTPKITAEVAVLNKYVTIFQNVYDAYKAIGITVTIQEISNLVSYTKKGNGRPDFELEFAVDKLLTMAGSYIFGGVQLDEQKLRDMILRPDVTAVKTALYGVNNISSGEVGTGVRINLLQLTSDVISKVSGADATIAALYTHYTATDASAQLATDLQVAIDAINTFYAAHTIVYAKAFAGNDMANMPREATGMPGLIFYGGQYHISLDYIRNFEAKAAA